MFKPKPFFFLTIILVLIIASPVFAEDKEELRFSNDWLKGVAIVVYQNQYGTCFWVNPSHVVTAAHVVNNQPNAVVTIIRGNVHARGVVVALDTQSDLAVIYVENSGQFDKYIFPLAVRIPEPSSTIYVIGYPFELLQIMGSLEALSENPRILESRLTWSANGLIELGGIVDAGNSGGPVLDYYGNVIGVVSFALRGNAGVLYFATTVGALRELLREHGIAYIEGTSSILPESIVQDPFVAGAIAGASAGLVLDILILATGTGLGILIASKRRRR
ncbi:trypsin-like peptidase domain-containing protein [Desulfurococcaceae archaeon MEX13E-LK6-19]|nr:trypsin-like peptidase domain-containing protein [Desulfurococcaceae archaeon MEX13E-LK6-19]